MNAFTRKHNARVASFKARKSELGFFGALRSEGGALDLASIMVGVLVIGAFAGIVAATVFAVIPWAQDRAAEGALDSVSQAESVAYAFAAEEGVATFADKAALTADPNVVSPDGSPLLQDDANLDIVLLDGGKNYAATIESDSGKLFHILGDAPGTVLDGAYVAPVVSP